MNDGRDWTVRKTGLRFFVPAVLLSYSLSSSDLIPPVLCLISILVFPRGIVHENTLANVPHFQQPYWMELALFALRYHILKVE